MFYKGVFFCLIGSALFTPVFAMGKFADGAFPAIALMTIRYAGGFLTTVIAVICAKIPFHEIRSPRPSQHLLRATFGAMGGICAVHAAATIPVAYATSIGLTQGMVVILLAGVFLKEVIQMRHWVACAISAFGALLIISQTLDLDNLGATNQIGALAAFAGAVFIAIETLYIKVLARHEHAVGVLLYVNGFGALIMMLICAVTFNLGHLLQWAIAPFVIVGPIAIAAQFFNIKAYRLVNASRLAPISYSWIIFATLLGWVAFNEVPTLLALFGGTLIVTGGIIVTRPSNAPNQEANT
ncbi:DMT family transporter [Planktotalea sp.]|uniref:DMT family transporter n=1 Tax=Planktotalea sp. TaxID=2029877 RepID=UPI003299B559